MAERPRRPGPVRGAWMPPRGPARRRNGARGHRTRYCRHILY